MKKNIIIALIILTGLFLSSIPFLYLNNKIDNSKIRIENEYLTFDKTGQIFIMSDGTFAMYGYNGKNLEIGTGGDVIINAGDKKLELRVGNENKIIIQKDKIDLIGDVFINNNLIN